VPDVEFAMSTIVTPMMTRSLWLVWILLAIAWVVPLAAGVLWLLTYQPNPSSQTAQTVFQGMVLCIMGMAASSILNLWLYLRRKRSARSTRWLAKGFIWSVAVTFLAVLWIRALFVAIHDDVTEHGAFVGWFGYALIMVAMVSFNLIVMWRRTHMRRRRRSHGRSPSEDD